MAYSDEQKAIGLAALAANGGNLTRTAKFTGIPESTLRFWRDGNINSDAAKKCELKKVELASLFEDFAARVMHLTTDDDIAGSKLGERFTALGIAVDKMRLLLAQPTQITENVSSLTDDELERRIAAFEGRETASLSRKEQPSAVVPA